MPPPTPIQTLALVHSEQDLCKWLDRRRQGSVKERVIAAAKKLHGNDRKLSPSEIAEVKSYVTTRLDQGVALPAIATELETLAQQRVQNPTQQHQARIDYLAERFPSILHSRLNKGTSAWDGQPDTLTDNEIEQVKAVVAYKLELNYARSLHSIAKDIRHSSFKRVKIHNALVAELGRMDANLLFGAMMRAGHAQVMSHVARETRSLPARDPSTRAMQDLYAAYNAMKDAGLSASWAYNNTRTLAEVWTRQPTLDLTQLQNAHTTLQGAGLKVGYTHDNAMAVANSALKTIAAMYDTHDIAFETLVGYYVEAIKAEKAGKSASHVNDFNSRVAQHGKRKAG